ncbi:MAG: hypothetical protein HY840_09655 [Bacteroidetes bacterium]|nr:hypothetical protein [Bacteroidota bacterium]
MPFSKINITLTAAQVTALQAAITALKNPANMPLQFNLTKAERTSLPNINNTRYPYVQRAIKNHGPNNAVLATGVAGLGVGTLAEAASDLTFYDQMENLTGQLAQILEIYKDTQQVAGSEAYIWTRQLYDYSKQAADNQVPGADAVVDDLSPMFEGQGGNQGSTPPPANPVP